MVRADKWAADQASKRTDLIISGSTNHQNVGEVRILDVDGDFLEHVLEGEFGILESVNVEVTLFVQVHQSARQTESLTVKEIAWAIGKCEHLLN